MSFNMFGNINHRQKQDEHPTDKNVQAENLLDQQQPQIQPMGNEGANVNLFSQMIKQANLETGNEFLTGLEEEDGNLSESGDNIINENNMHNIVKEEGNGEDRADLNDNLINSLKNDPGKIIEKIADAAPKDNVGRNKEPKDALRNEEQKNDAEARPKAEAVKDAVQDIFPDQMEEIEDFYQDPEPVRQAEEEEDILNTSMIVHAPKKHNIKGKKKKNDIKKAAAPMERIKGLNVAVQKLPERKKAGWWSRFLTGTAWYAGKSIGKAINWLANLLYCPGYSRKIRMEGSACRAGISGS